MLSPDKRQQIERESAREIHRFHRDTQPTTFASIVDDIRHKVLEEGWFGRQVTGNIADARITDDETHEIGEETASYKAVYGEAAPGWRESPQAEGGLDIHGNPIEPAPPHIKGPEADL